jgi:integrase
MKTTTGELFTRKTQKHGNVYCLRYQHQGTRRKITLKDENGQPITNKRTAEQAAASFLAPIRHRTEADRRKAIAASYQDAVETAQELEAQSRAKTTIASMWDVHPWDTNTRGSTERQLANTSVKDNLALWQKFITWATGNNLEFAEDTTTDHAAAFRDTLTGLSGDRINKAVMTAKVMFDLSGITPNPFIGLRKRHHKAQGRRELSSEELATVCGTAKGELRTLFAIGLYTGLRLGDACRLQWREVSNDLTRITIEPTKTAYKRDSQLVLPIHAVLRAILAETPERDGDGYIMPKTAARYETDKPGVSKTIQKHFTDNNIETHRPGTGKGTGTRAIVEIGFHSLRHSFVSLCARQGVPLHVVQSLCGHSSPEVQRLYLHNSLADSEKAIASLPSITGTTTTTQSAKDQIHAIVESMNDDEAAELLAKLA